ncbi:acid phosphatase [Candidatus Marinamargulisbacteria bacterium SCGC AG-343-K17]|nr:acid phosphatase [Candidatus Marinamargulisbacteria bacterium SCGC AG-343-K17]
MLNDILFNFFPLIASLSSMTISQSIKLLCMILTGKKINLVSLTRSGGMPSSHSALITAITLSIGLKNGFSSSHFFLSVVLSLVVIYDARGIRHTVGNHAQILNNSVLSTTEKKLNEHVGHTFPEIIAGISIGIIVSLAMYNVINF